MNLARSVEEAGIPILGTPTANIELAENREKFRNLVVNIDLNQPRSLVAVNRDETLTLAETLGFPVLVRPSHVLGGRGMRVCYGPDDLELLFSEGVPVSKESPLLIDAFLEDAVELDVDAVSDGERVVVALEARATADDAARLDEVLLRRGLVHRQQLDGGDAE